MKPLWDIARVFVVGGLLAMMGGCSSATSLSDDFGESTATAVRAQRVHPRPVEPMGGGFVLDGQPTERIIQRYIQSFDRSSPATSPGVLMPAAGSVGSGAQQ